MQDRAIVGYGPAVQVRLQNDLWSAIESFRRSEPDIPTRPEAVRRFLQRALDIVAEMPWRQAYQINITAGNLDYLEALLSGLELNRGVVLDQFWQQASSLYAPMSVPIPSRGNAHNLVGKTWFSGKDH